MEINFLVQQVVRALNLRASAWSAKGDCGQSCDAILHRDLPCKLRKGRFRILRLLLLVLAARTLG